MIQEEKHLLDLRETLEPQIKIVEKIVIQRRSLKRDLFMIFSVMFIASGIIWGISKASNFDVINSFEDTPPQNFSASGIVSNVTNLFGKYITIEEATGSDDSGKSSYSFGTNKVKKIENADYVPLKLSDIKIGDKIVVQGLLKEGGDIEAYRIISFTTVIATTTEELVATSTEATSTDETASSTDTSTSTSTDTTSSSTDILVLVPTNETTSSASDGSENINGSSTKDIDPTPNPSLLPDFLTSTSTETSQPESPIEPVTLPEIVSTVIEKVVEVVTGTSDDPELITSEPAIISEPNPSEALPEPVIESETIPV
jgi:hypothetical protein